MTSPQVSGVAVAGADDPLWRMRDLTKYLNCHSQTIYRLVARGDIPFERLGKRRLRFRKSAIDQWLADQAKPTEGAA